MAKIGTKFRLMLVQEQLPRSDLMHKKSRISLMTQRLKLLSKRLCMRASEREIDRRNQIKITSRSMSPYRKKLKSYQSPLQ
jgi:hypothetical protein